MALVGAELEVRVAAVPGCLQYSTSGSGSGIGRGIGSCWRIIITNSAALSPPLTSAAAVDTAVATTASTATAATIATTATIATAAAIAIAIAIAIAVAAVAVAAAFVLLISGTRQQQTPLRHSPQPIGAQVWRAGRWDGQERHRTCRKGNHVAPREKGHREV